MLKVRYMILLMGMFALYCGIIYNDFMSLPMNLMGYTCYDNKGDLKSPDCVFPVGLDPKWYMAKNKIQFFNSMKMKIAVILGVA